MTVGVRAGRVQAPSATVGPDRGEDRPCACGAGYRDTFGVRRCGHWERMSERRARLGFRLSFLAWSARRTRGFIYGRVDPDAAGEERASYIARARVAARRMAELRRFACYRLP